MIFTSVTSPLASKIFLSCASVMLVGIFFTINRLIKILQPRPGSPNQEVTKMSSSVKAKTLAHNTKSSGKRQPILLPKIPKGSSASTPRYLQVKGYKDYKYKSYLIDLMKEDKKTQKLLPYHLQSLPKTNRKRYELNISTKNELLHNSRLDNIFTDTEQEPRRMSVNTQGGSAIFSNYSKLMKSYQHDSYVSNRESSHLCEEITINNTIIGNVIENEKMLTVNPRLLSRHKKEPYREMNTIKEFRILVQNTKEYLEMQNLPAYMNRPYLFQFILRDAYNSFKELPELIQDRIFVSFEINPHNEEEKVYYEQFSRFKQLIISQTYREHELVDYLVQFFNPWKLEQISVSDVRAILTLILGQKQNIQQLLKYFLKNLTVSRFCQDSVIVNLRGVFEEKVIDPNQLFDLLLNNI